MVTLKGDADRVGQFLKKLANEDWVRRSERRVWPLFLFHYTDISNAVGILRDGYLYSRKQLEDVGRTIVDAGSSSVLAGTNTLIKDCVRFYFRPKTPTQYHAEGICSRAWLASCRFPDAHCPVPVFFLFDAAKILSRSDAWFSDGGLGSPSARIFSTSGELEQLPWRKIYHTGRFDPSSAGESDITLRRNAEVLIPRKIDLAALRFIYCRSDAEKETLLCLLTAELRNRYGGKIVATTRSEFYYRRHTFILKAHLAPDGIFFHFSPETSSPGPFHARVEVNTPSGQRSRDWSDFNLACLSDNTWKLMLRPRASNYAIRVLLDGHLAYANVYRETDLPF